MKKTRESIEQVLPQFEHFPRRCEPDAYGASFLIAQKLGLSDVPKSSSTWTHGWPYVPVVYPEQVAQESNAIQTNLVPTEKIAQKLRSEFSYQNVHAVGSPFIYASPLDVERIPNSLLVMPPHTLPYLEDEWDEEKYVSSIKDVIDEFDHVFACIHRHDAKKRNWIDTFSKAGIPCIKGTQVRDKYGLTRMQTLFHLFEFVTSNTIGSHLAYASYCGCKVSVYGPYAHRSIEDFKKDPVWSGEREPILRHNLKYTQEDHVKKKYPFLFASPSESRKHTDWAERELGVRYKRSPTTLSRLLGWGFRKQFLLKANKWKNKAHRKLNRLKEKIL